MIPMLLALGRALGEHVREHRDASLKVHEQGLLEALRLVAPRLLETMVTGVRSGLDARTRPVKARCPSCQQRRLVQSRRTRQLQTRVGPMRIERAWHHCTPCGHGWSPSDRVLGVAAHQRTSVGLARWEALPGAVTTFDEASRLLAQLAGVHVGTETLRVQAERVGTELEGQLRRTLAYVEAQHEPPPTEYDPAPGTLVVETDGVMVRYRDRCLDGVPLEGDWHEVKLGVVGGWVGQRPRAALQTPSYVAAREPAAAFARRLGTEAARRRALDVVECTRGTGRRPNCARWSCWAMEPGGSGTTWLMSIRCDWWAVVKSIHVAGAGR